MADWAPIILGVLLFILLSPGLIFQLPGNISRVEFGSFMTNGKAIFIHTLIFFGVFTILIWVQIRTTNIIGAIHNGTLTQWEADKPKRRISRDLET
ncbi:hypothetical protein L1049_027391 [Liquidambar formosana]|uniref:Transmembrane protein n=1 Tax=Liquidambar formosana TaxID=63359 RepID=A0AAP0RH80_LIQFO